MKLFRLSGLAALATFLSTRALAGVVVSISSPTANQSFSGNSPVTVSVSARANDTINYTIVSFTGTLDGNSITLTTSGMNTTGASATATLSFSSGSNTSHTLSLTARDTNGAQGTASVTFTVTVASQETFTFSNTSLTYNGSSQAPTVTVSPAGAPYTTSGAQTNAGGPYTFTATASSPNTGSASTTFTIAKANQAAVTCTNPENCSYQAAYSPWVSPFGSASGGSGTGGWQFCIVSQTNWDGGASSYTGTNLGTSPGNSSGAHWSATWTALTGSQTYYVVRDEDSNYNPSSMLGPYTLTVAAPQNGITWNSVNGQASSYSLTAQAGQPVSIPANVTNSGQSTWSSGYYLGLWDNNGNGQAFPSISGVAPGGSTTAAFNFTMPGTPGTYTYTMKAEQYGVQYFGPVESITLTALSNPAPSITSSTNASGTVGQGFSYAITATNYPTSYGASGLPAGLTVNTSTGAITGTPTAAGTYSVPLTATNATGTGSATLTLSIAKANQSAMSISPSGSMTVAVGQVVTFSAAGGTGTGAYIWGGAAGSGSMATETFNTAGSFTVSVYQAADANYNQSNTASVAVTVVTATYDASGADTQLKILAPTH